MRVAPREERKLLSILSGGSCWPKNLVVRGAHKKTPRQRQAHGAGQPRYICLPSLEFRSAHPMLRSCHSTLARRDETGAPLFASSLFSVMPTNKSNHAFRPCPLLPKQPKATVVLSLDPGSAWSAVTVDGRPPIPPPRHGHCMDLAVTADRSVCPCGTDRREQGPITIVAASRLFRRQEDHDTSTTFSFHQEPQRSAALYWSVRKLRCEALAGDPVVIRSIRRM
jgi:hypothetical protein